MQRLLKTRLFSDVPVEVPLLGLAAAHRGGGPRARYGQHPGQGYAELPWVLDIAIAVLWVAFAVNFFGTIAIRRERHLYVAIWFYIATIVAVAILHIGNSVAVPVLVAWKLLGLLGRQGRADAVVVRPQRRGVLPHDALPRPDVLLPAEGGRAAGVQLSALHHALLVARLRLHLGRPASPPLLGRPRVGVHARDAVLPHPPDAVLGRHGQRALHPARRLAPAARGPDPEVHGRGGHLLRHVDLRGPDDVDQVGECRLALHRLDDRPRSRRSARLERLPFVRDPLLGRPAALEDAPVLQQAGDHALLGRDGRPDPLPGLDVGRRHHPVGHVARLRGRRPPGVPRLHRDGDRDRPALLGPPRRRDPLLCGRDPPRVEHRPDDPAGAGRLRRGARGERAAAREGPVGAGCGHAGQHLRPRILPSPALAQARRPPAARRSPGPVHRSRRAGPGRRARSSRRSRCSSTRRT